MDVARVGGGENIGHLTNEDNEVEFIEVDEDAEVRGGVHTEEAAMEELGQLED